MDWDEWNLSKSHVNTDPFFTLNFTEHAALPEIGSAAEPIQDSRCKGYTGILEPREMLSQEPIEWPEKIEMLIDHLESESAERDLSREERALMDVYETVPILESEDCLHEFWQSDVNHQRIINSFDLIGAASLVDPLNASRWCGTASPDRSDYSETEEEYLATIEEELPAGMDELVDLVLEFIEEELD